MMVLNEFSAESMNIPTKYKVKYLELKDKDRETYFNAYMGNVEAFKKLKVNKNKYESALLLLGIVKNFKTRYSLVKPDGSDKMAYKLLYKQIEVLHEKGFLEGKEVMIKELKP